MNDISENELENIWSNIKKDETEAEKIQEDYNKNIYLKDDFIFKQGDSCPKEVSLISYLSDKTDFNVPEIHYINQNDKMYVSQRLNGCLLEDIDDKSRFAEKIGFELRDLHSYSLFDGWGELEWDSFDMNPDDVQFETEYDDYENYIYSLLEKCQDLSEGTRYKELVEDCSNVFNNCELSRIPESSILYTEIASDDIIVKDGEVYFFDFEYARIGDPYEEIVKAHSHLQWMQQGIEDDFLESYGFNFNNVDKVRLAVAILQIIKTTLELNIEDEDKRYEYSKWICDKLR